MKPNSLGYWRKYFRTANRDVFDIIDGAIMVAASDCPQEFKIRRGRIAERLFSCRLARCSGCERVELAVPSVDDAVDNNEEDGLMKSGIAGDGDDRRGSKGRRGNSTGRDDCEDLIINHESNYSYGEAEALTDKIEVESRILEEVSRIKEILMNYEDETESVLFESLRRLQLMELTVAILKGTGIGITVNLLRKHRSKQISRLAQALISLWKSMVDEWMQTAQDIPGGTPDSVNPSTVVDEEEEGLPSPPLDEGAFLATEPTSIELSGFFDGMDDDGNPRKSRVLPNNCEKIRKSSLPSPGRNGIDQLIENRTTNQVKNPVRREKPEPLKKERPVVKPNSNPEHVGHPDPSASRKINKESKPQLRRLENPAITTQGRNWGNQQDVSNEESATQTKLEATKRKLQVLYREAENAKKQRTVQVMELRDLPKRGGTVVNQRNASGRPGNQNKRWANGRQ